VRIDDIAAAAGVGKQTIYRWWPSKQAVVIDALLHHSTGDTPFPDTGDARRDLRAHMLAVTRIFTSSIGALLREILAESYGHPDVARGFVERFWQPRRELSTAFLRQAMSRGQVRPDLDVEAALDTVYSPLWTRLLIGHQPLDDEFVDRVLDVVWPGLAATANQEITSANPTPAAGPSTTVTAASS
jgi:AcrR family transcriptional regulator